MMKYGRQRQVRKDLTVPAVGLAIATLAEMERMMSNVFVVED